MYCRLSLLTSENSPDYCSASDGGVSSGESSLIFHLEGYMTSNAQGQCKFGISQRCDNRGRWDIALGMALLGVFLQL